MTNHVLIYEFGSQYTQIIAKIIRKLNVYCVVHPPEYPLESLQTNPPSAVILSGSPYSVHDKSAPSLPNSTLSFINTQKIPILAICYGMQFLTHYEGGTVETNTSSEYGETQLEVLDQSNPLFIGIPQKSVIWMSHSDSITKLPPGYTVIGRTDSCKIVVASNIERLTWMLQYHPEVHNSEFGEQIYRNFIYGICKITPDWTPPNYKMEQIKYIQKTVGKSKVLAAVSGGKDSTIAAALVNAAVGAQLNAVFIDNGLLRENEAREAIERIKREIPGIKLDLFDASEMFLSRLKDAKTSSEIRYTVGSAYIDAFKEYVSKNPFFSEKNSNDDIYLLQGTIYSDHIESGKSSTKSATIQLHHNVGALPEELGFKLLEPIKYLFKDEVLRLGQELGVSAGTLSLHPFPGPSFAVRIMGPINKENIKILRQATKILEDELRSAGLYDKVSQAFVVLLPCVNTNFIKGDSKFSGNNMTAVIRCVNTTDFMTCTWSKLPFEFLSAVSTKITNQVKDICRVTYDITNKPPATTEWL